MSHEYSKRIDTPDNMKPKRVKGYAGLKVEG